MAATKRQYHDSAANSSSTIFKSVSTNRHAAQSFTTTSAYSISSVKILIYRFGLPETLTVSIREVSGDDPTGDDLAVSTFDADIITEDTDGEWKEIIFDTPYELAATTKYTIYIRNEGAAHGVGPALYWLGVSGASSYPNGAGRYSFNGGVGWSSAAKDFNFETWGSDITRQVENPTPSDTDINITLTPRLQWEVSGEGLKEGDSFDVYLKAGDFNFGPEDLLRNVTDLDVQIIAGLTYNTVYYWQVIPFSEEGDLLGADAWSFTTILFLPPVPSGGGNPNGLNNMITLKRLVVATNNSIYYET